MEDDHIAVCQLLFRNTQTRMVTIDGIHPAASGTIGKLAESDAILGDVFHIISVGITHSQIIFCSNHVKNIEDRCSGLHFIVLCCNPHLQIIINQSVDFLFCLSMLMISQQCKVDGVSSLGNDQFYQQAVQGVKIALTVFATIDFHKECIGAGNIQAEEFLDLCSGQHIVTKHTSPHGEWIILCTLITACINGKCIAISTGIIVAVLIQAPVYNKVRICRNAGLINRNIGNGSINALLIRSKTGIDHITAFAISGYR